LRPLGRVRDAAPQSAAAAPPLGLLFGPLPDILRRQVLHLRRGRGSKVRHEEDASAAGVDAPRCDRVRRGGRHVSRATWVLVIAAGFAALTGCRGGSTKETPIVGIRNMYDQPRYNIQSRSDFFEDHRTMRLPVENTVAREEVLDPEIASGRLP